MKYYIGVASKNHIEIGKKLGFCQFCHGKQSVVKKLKKDDWIIYYSSKIEFGKNDICQKFTAIGQITDEKEYQIEQFAGFCPWRRNIQYYNSIDVDIRLLLEDLSFIKNKKNWGVFFRYGFFEISYEDFEILKNKMII